MDLRSNESGLMKACSRISVVFLALYFLDIILMGTGALTRVGPLSARILFFALAILFSVPVLFSQLRSLLKTDFVIIMVLVLLWIAVSAFRGFRNGNSMSVLKTDVFGYLNYAIVPTMICMLSSEKRRNAILKTVIFSTLLVAFLVLVLDFYLYFPNPDELYEFFEGNGLCGITILAKPAVRIFFHTGSRYFLVAYMFALYFYYVNRRSAQRFLWLGAMSLFLYGIFASYSRGAYAGSFLAVAAVFALQFAIPLEDRKKLILGMIASAVGALVIIGAVSLIQHVNLISVALGRTVEASHTSKEEIKHVANELSKHELSSPNAQAITEAGKLGLGYRQWERMLLADSIAKSPIIGHGLGRTLPPFDNVEYSYHDVVNKMGVVGLVLLVLPLLNMAWRLWKGRKNGAEASDLLLCLLALASSGYFLFIAYSNPCMNTTVGISCYCLCMALVNRYTRPAET